MPPFPLNEADELLVKTVERAYKMAEAEHKAFRAKAEKYYALYRSYSDLKRKTDARDRDEVVYQAQKTYGTELFIPFIYSTIETIVPRMVAHRPRMLIVPRNEQALGSVNNMKLVVDAQQKQINYELILQNIAKDGLIYGLGVGKTRWKFETRIEVKVAPSEMNPELFEQALPKKVTAFDDAIAERVDPFDFLWDPYGDSMDTVEYVIHRQWRNRAYIKRMVETGVWRASENDETCEWSLEDMLSSAPATKRSQIMDERLTVEGYSSTQTRDQQLHEVWEFHDGQQVIQVLDNTFPVQAGPNPSGEARIPFQVYRPTVVGGRFVGVSEVEPLEHLQYELNTLRSQRRDAAALALMRTFAYNETAIDGDDIVLGPGLAIPVAGDPKEFLFPIPVPDIPASGYQEENVIKDDISRTSGISDPVSGGDTGASETATGVQLVQAAATMRIQNKSRLLESQIIVPQGNEFVNLNQRRILTARTVFIPEAPDPDDPHIPSWKMVKLTPRELMGRMAVEVEGGSTGPENVPQQRQDAQQFFALAQDPRLEGEKMLFKGLSLMGIEQPESFIKPPEPTLPVSAVQQLFQQAGAPPGLLEQLLQQGPPGTGPPGEEQGQEPQAQNGQAPPEEAMNPAQ